MAKLKGLTLSKTNVSQTINLEDVTGVSFRGEKELRQAIAQRVIEYIVNRTQSGEDVSHNNFSKYSLSYTESAGFKLLKDSKEVNMTLTGNMLASMDVLADSGNTIQIGFKDKTETAKAFNHNTGDTLPKREFFGISQSDLKDLIKSEFGPDLAKLKGKDEGVTTVANILAKGLLVTPGETGKQLAIIFNTIEDFNV